jgi:hypothetical protein
VSYRIRIYVDKKQRRHYNGTAASHDISSITRENVGLKLSKKKVQPPVTIDMMQSAACALHANADNPACNPVWIYRHHHSTFA